MMDVVDEPARETLFGRKICVTGRLMTMTHAELSQLVAAQGGTFLRRPRRTNFTLVIGEDGWPARIDGSPTRALQYATHLLHRGYRVDILPEAEFLAQCGFVQDAQTHGAFTMGDVAQILGISTVRVRRWMRAGLLQPSDSSYRLAIFDFRQVANARRLCELLRAGTSLAAIRTGLEQLRRWLPEENLPLAPLARLEHDGRLLLRLTDGLIDARGQRHFDFEAQRLGEATLEMPPVMGVNVDDLFEAALEAEDAGDWPRAAELYAMAIAHEPDDPVLHFNHGNVLFELARFADCQRSFETSLALDPHYAEAWHNLGNALAQQGKLVLAVAALRRAVELIPSYGAAHLRLADLLQTLGRGAEAAEHRSAAQTALRRLPGEGAIPPLKILRP